MLTKFQNRFELLPENAYLAKQVHGTHALRVHASDSQAMIAGTEADALWTTDADVLLAVKTADCGPVLLWHKDGQCAVAIHAGWKGVVANIVGKTLSEVRRETGLSMADFHAQIGPCLSFDRFEIGPEVASQVSEKFLKSGVGDRSYLDLKGLIRSQLEEAGVVNIEVSENCTLSEPKSYFSNRRGDLGRQYSLVSL
ncbi:MAG: polyphenol oxidase family protein [Myxococcota bacterium]